MATTKQEFVASRRQ